MILQVPPHNVMIDGMYGLVWRWGVVPKCPIYHLVTVFNIAMENDPFIDGLPINNGDFPWLC